MVRSSVLVGFCALAFACANSSPSSRRTLALYSWKPGGEPWHFALIPDQSPKHVSKGDVVRTATPLVGVGALKARLASTPRNSWAIIWRDDPPDYTLRYPPSGVCDDIIAFGRQHGLNIERWPTIYE